jgi:hypothetical protein
MKSREMTAAMKTEDEEKKLGPLREKLVSKRSALAVERAHS